MGNMVQAESRWTCLGYEGPHGELKVVQWRLQVTASRHEFRKFCFRRVSSYDTVYMARARQAQWQGSSLVLVLVVFIETNNPSALFDLSERPAVLLQPFSERFSRPWV